jgi:hypothetical protein
MAKSWVAMRALVGLVLLMSVVLSGCGVLRRADAAPNVEPEVPAVETGEGIIIDSVEMLILESWPVQVQAVIRGHRVDGCTVVDEIRVDRDETANRFVVTMITSRTNDAMCTMALVSFEEEVSLDVEGLPAGTYTVEAHGVSATFTLDADNVFMEEPASEGAYIDSVEVVVKGTDPAQAEAVIRGNLPDGCTEIVEYLVVYQEETETYTITVGTYRDPEAMCTMALVPFEETLDLSVGGLPAGTYRVEVHGVSATFELE